MYTIVKSFGLVPVSWSMTGQLLNEHGTLKLGNFVSRLSHLVFQSLPALMPTYLKTLIDKRPNFSLHVRSTQQQDIDGLAISRSPNKDTATWAHRLLTHSLQAH